MKVLLYTDWGTNHSTPEMQKILEKKPFPLNRTGEIITHLESVSEVIEIHTEADYEALKKDLKRNKNRIVRFAEDKENNFYFYSQEEKEIFHVSIEEVDTSRPWRIHEYDSSEFIQYLDYEVVCEEMNYCELK